MPRPDKTVHRPEALSLRQVRYFVEVATSGSLTAASRVLRVSQPAIGQQVRQLEEALGLELFQRHSRGVRLTRTGQSWLPAAEGILRAVDEAGTVARGLSAPAGVDLRLGVTPSVARSLLPQLLYRSTCPGMGLRLEFVEGMSDELAEQVAAGTLDIAFGYRPSRVAGVTVHALADETLCVVGPVSRIGEGSAPFPASRVAGLPLVLGRRPNRIRDLLEGALEASGHRIGPVMELDLAGLKRDFLLGRDYCAVSPRGLFLSDIREGRLGGRPIDAPGTRQRLYLLARAGLPPGDLETFHRAIAEVLRKDVAVDELCWSLCAPPQTAGPPGSGPFRP